MAKNNSSTAGQSATAPPNQARAIPEPTFRSAIMIGALALAFVAVILVYGLINGH